MKASAIVLVGNVAGAAAGFAAAIVAARVLAVDEFAAFGVGLAVNSLAVQFGDFGLGTIAIAETADSLDSRMARVKLHTLTFHRIRVGIAVALLMMVVVLLLPPLAPYRLEGLIAASGEVFGSLAFFFIWCLQGERRFVAAGAMQGLQGALRLVLVCACAVAGLGAAPMMLAYAVAAPMAVALAGWGLLFVARTDAAHADVPDADPSASEIDLDRRRVMAIASVFSAMVINGDVLLLAMLAGKHDVAVYSAAWRFSSGILLANTAIAGAFLPFIVTAPNPWAEAKHLVRRGLGVVGGWLALIPFMAIIGPILLGSIGDEARMPLIILALAFAIDGFYFVVYQIYLRIRRERVLLGLMIVELATMAGVTLLLRNQGALAPAYGQLAARVVICLGVATPILLAAAKRCDWFDGGDEHTCSLRAQCTSSKV